MCNHYEVDDDIDEFEAAVARIVSKLVEINRWYDTQHAWPKRPMPIVSKRDGEFRVEQMRWGIWPWFQKDKPRFVTNSRDDSLTKSVWKNAVAKRRCLVPASAYYEPAGPVGAKWEVRFTVPAKPLFFIAGLWDTDPDESGTRAFSLVTTTPNPMVAAYHDRMPVVLSDEVAAAWIGDEPLPDGRLPELLRAYPGEAMAAVDQPKPQRAIKKADLQPGGDFNPEEFRLE